MKSAHEQLITLVRDIPELVLTGSRYFGTSNNSSDWDFMLPETLRYKLPISFHMVDEPQYTQKDPLIVGVLYNFDMNCHIQLVKAEYMELKIEAQKILQETNALTGTDKSFHKFIWRAVTEALANKKKFTVISY